MQIVVLEQLDVDLSLFKDTTEQIPFVSERPPTFESQMDLVYNDTLMSPIQQSNEGKSNIYL